MGCSVEEILEIIIQMSSYSGFPGSLNAINVLKEVIKDRKITFEPIKENKNGDRFSIGLEMLSQLEKTRYKY